MSDNLVKRLRRRWPNEDPKTQAEKREAADRIEELEAKLAEYKHVSSAIDTQWAESQDEIAVLKAKLERQMSDDQEPSFDENLPRQLLTIASVAEKANHWTDGVRLMPAAGVADVLYEALGEIEYHREIADPRAELERPDPPSKN